MIACSIRKLLTQVCVSFQREQTIVSHSFYTNKHRLIIFMFSVIMLYQYNNCIDKALFKTQTYYQYCSNNCMFKYQVHLYDNYSFIVTADW